MVQTSNASADPGPKEGSSGALTAKRVDVPKELAEEAGIKPQDVYEWVCYDWENPYVTLGQSCYETSGDDQWVRDTMSDGLEFRTHVQTYYGKNRFCADNTSGWTECKYDHRENTCVRWHGYLPPHLSEDWTPWIDTSDGDTYCA